MLEMLINNIIGLLFLLIGRYAITYSFLNRERLTKPEVSRIIFIFICVLSISINKEFYLLPAILIIVFEFFNIIRKPKNVPIEVN
jgi:hypothetical protein